MGIYTRKWRTSVFICSLFVYQWFQASFALATVFTLPVLDPTQVQSLFDVLASTVVFRSLEPPSHPNKYGFWLNVRATLTSSTSLASFANVNTAVIPFGNIQGGINGPFGLGIELGYLPNPSISGTSYSSFGGSLKWNFLKLVRKKMPFEAALRGIYSAAGVKYEQSLSNSPISVDYSTKVYGGVLDISKPILFLEPYIGYGLIHQSSSLTGTGSVSLFDTSFPLNTSTVSDGKVSGWFRAGVEVKILVLAVGFQYDTTFNTETYSAKAGFKF